MNIYKVQIMGDNKDKICIKEKLSAQNDYSYKTANRKATKEEKST